MPGKIRLIMAGDRAGYQRSVGLQLAPPAEPQQAWRRVGLARAAARGCRQDRVEYLRQREVGQAGWCSSGERAAGRPPTLLFGDRRRPSYGALGPPLQTHPEGRVGAVAAR